MENPKGSEQSENIMEKWAERAKEQERFERFMVPLEIEALLHFGMGKNPPAGE